VATLTPQAMVARLRPIPKPPSSETLLRNQTGTLTRRAGELESGADATRGAALNAFMGFDPEKYLSADALQSLFDQAGTGFRQDLGNLRATNERRGIRGPLAGATEGDLGAAFQRNLLSTAANFAGTRASLSLQRAQGISDRANADSELAFATRGQGLETLAGMADRELADEIARRQEKAGRRRGLGAGIGALAGGALGFALGGPTGAGVGSSIGGQAGAGFFG
jgi:hypothetical protein